jgi:hypothetical protein
MRRASSATPGSVANPNPAIPYEIPPTIKHRAALKEAIGVDGLRSVDGSWGVSRGIIMRSWRERAADDGPRGETAKKGGISAAVGSRRNNGSDANWKGERHSDERCRVHLPDEFHTSPPDGVLPGNARLGLWKGVSLNFS